MRLMNWKLFLAYTSIFVIMVGALLLLHHQSITTPEYGFWVVTSALLFTLLVHLSARLIKAESRVESLLCTALFTLFFFPSFGNILTADLNAVIELGSWCIVPFFIGQYQRVRVKDFKRIYMLMFFMGVFCSYTHDGITIPLCAAFLWSSYRDRLRFFRSACWPMVLGFVLGTSLSLWHAHGNQTAEIPVEISNTIFVLRLFWDTKVFMCGMILSLYLTLTRWGRTQLRESLISHTLLVYCLVFSLCSLPFAPLGLDNAITGVCFFSMLWLLILVKSLLYHFYFNAPVSKLPVMQCLLNKRKSK